MLERSEDDIKSGNSLRQHGNQLPKLVATTAEWEQVAIEPTFQLGLSLCPRFELAAEAESADPLPQAL